MSAGAERLILHEIMRMVRSDHGVAYHGDKIVAHYGPFMMQIDHTGGEPQDWLRVTLWSFGRSVSGGPGSDPFEITRRRLRMRGGKLECWDGWLIKRQQR